MHHSKLLEFLFSTVIRTALLDHRLHAFPYNDGKKLCILTLPMRFSSTCHLNFTCRPLWTKKQSPLFLLLVNPPSLDHLSFAGNSKSTHDVRRLCGELFPRSIYFKAFRDRLWFFVQQHLRNETNELPYQHFLANPHEIDRKFIPNPYSSFRGVSQVTCTGIPWPNWV